MDVRSQVGAIFHPVVLLRAFYLAAALLIVVIQAVPALRSRFLAYGSRATSPPSHPTALRQPTPVSQLLDYAATFQVPHNYFTHFYVLSVACSLFWGWQLRVWESSTQLQVVWGLMLLQGVRRMLEASVFTSTSRSKMWVAHWLLGFLFYVTINIAIWVEGEDSASTLTDRETKILVPAILTAHALQHSYHAYLYELRMENKGYRLPAHPIFSNLLCPHYTCETTIYVLLSFLAAPAGSIVNWTLLCGSIFVAVNLGVTASGTKEWYTEKFGKDLVGPRKRMIPGIW